MGKTYAGNLLRSEGYRALLSEIRMSDFYDPWGAGMGWVFTLAGVLYTECGEIMPGYRPGLGMSRESLSEEYDASTILELWDDGKVTEDDLTEVYAVMSRYVAWVKLAGRDY